MKSTISVFFAVTAVFSASSLASPSKVIDFEGDVVEGLHKRPLDSVSQISEDKKRLKGLHLYRKRKGFESETRSLLGELQDGGESE